MTTYDEKLDKEKLEEFNRDADNIKRIVGNTIRNKTPHHAGYKQTTEDILIKGQFDQSVERIKNVVSDLMKPDVSISQIGGQIPTMNHQTEKS